MDTTFESNKNRKAFTYTIIICAILLLLAFIITWPVHLPATHISQDLIEINLGNNDEGFGDIQPLIKGEMSPAQKPETPQQQINQATADENEITPEETGDKDAAPVLQPKNFNKKNTPTTEPQVKKDNIVPVNTPEPKPQKPRFTYDGPGNGKGNGATEDNGYTYQGSKPGGTGDAGDPSGNPDSYGNTPGGKKGGARVTSGDRKIVRSYSFTGDLEKATIYATVKVSPEGRGQFIGFAKNSSSRNPSYSAAIASYLKNMQFDKADHESTITVQFNFTVN